MALSEKEYAAVAKKGVPHLLSLLPKNLSHTNTAYRILPAVFYAPTSKKVTQVEYLLPQTPRASPLPTPDTAKEKDNTKRQLINSFDSSCKPSSPKRSRKEDDGDNDSGDHPKTPENEHQTPLPSSTPAGDTPSTASSSTPAPSSSTNSTSTRLHYTPQQQAQIKRAALNYLDLEASVAREPKKATRKDDLTAEYDSQFSRDFDDVCF